MRYALVWQLPAALLLMYILLPLLNVFGSIEWPGALVKLKTPLVINALRVSGASTLISLVIIVLLGTPLGYILARYQFRVKRMADTLVDLPTVLPPAVAGVALLIAFGRKGLVGRYISLAGVEVPFTIVAVVMAQVFIAAPLYVRAARGGFAAVDPLLEMASLTTGKTPWQTFRRITLPLALPSLLGGAVMSWARALGEFGATILFAGNLPGHTQTLPLAIYSAMESDLDTALVISALMVFLSFLIIFMLRWLAE